MAMRFILCILMCSTLITACVDSGDKRSEGLACVKIGDKWGVYQH